MSTKRLCFVIMPFSATKSCSEDEWFDIFENVIKPAVEESGFDFICRRSVATRGNIIKDILNDLNDADVVIADLTDQNPNVMYELGVRHVLATKTILIAQTRNDIPFDLRPYANHVYKWTTQKDKSEFKAKMSELLADIVKRPERNDNPVVDFLGEIVKHGLSFFSHVKDAPQFSELVEVAEHEVFALGPNLLYVAQNLKPLVFKKAEEGVNIKLLIMEHDIRAVNLIENYASTAVFYAELKLCHETFKQWLEEASYKGRDIQVKVAPIVPISLNIVDGQYDNGRMLLIPLPYRTAGAERPCILIEKRADPEAFSLYYDKFMKWWNQCRHLEWLCLLLFIAIKISPLPPLICPRSYQARDLQPADAPNLFLFKIYV